MSLGYYDRQGQPITIERWRELFEMDVNGDYRRVAFARVGDVEISTVWLGLDHSFTAEGPPIIFETLVFGGNLDMEQVRYATEEEALVGHRAMLEAVEAVEREETQ